MLVAQTDVFMTQNNVNDCTLFGSQTNAGFRKNEIWEATLFIMSDWNVTKVFFAKELGSPAMRLLTENLNREPSSCNKVELSQNKKNIGHLFHYALMAKGRKRTCRSFAAYVLVCQWDFWMCICHMFITPPLLICCLSVFCFFKFFDFF